MPDRFSHYWPLDGDVKSEVWKQGIIALDANVILSLYRVPTPLRARMLTIFNHRLILNRLWFPHQVAEEVFRNRLTVINDQISTMVKAQSVLKEGIDGICAAIDQNVRRHHPILDREAWKTSLRRLHEQLDEGLTQKPITVEEDVLLQKIKALMANRIGDAYTQAEVPTVRKEAERRIRESIPPGFHDAKKDNGDSHGDYMVWEQMLREAMRQSKHLLFVTEDDKDDWWLTMRGKRMGPRPELRREFHERTKKHCDFSSTTRLLEWATANLSDLPEFPEGREFADILNKDFLSTAIGNPTLERLRQQLAGIPGSEQVGAEEDYCMGVDEMVAWFFERYEDPANGVPFDSREGGYQYVNGGPYDAEEVLREEFPDTPDEVIADAVDHIQGYGWEWVKKGQY